MPAFLPETRRVLVASIISLVVLLLVALVSLLLLALTGRMADLASDDEALRVFALQSLRIRVADLAAANRAFLLTRDPSAWNLLRERSDEAATALGVATERLREAPDAALLGDVHLALADYRARIQSLAERAARKGASPLSADDVIQQWQTDIQPARQRLDGLVDALSTAQHARFDAARKAASEAFATSRSIAAAMVALALATGGGCVFVLRRAVGALRRAELRSRLVVDGAREHAIFLLDEHGSITSWNVGGERLFGWSEREILGRPYSALFLPDDQAAGRPARCLGETMVSGHHEEEGVLQTRAGQRFWASRLLTRVAPWDGVPGGFAVVIRDVTERRVLESRLSETAQQTAFVQEAGRLGVWTRDLDTNEVTVSPSLAAQLGYALDEIAPTLEWFYDRLHPDDVARVNAELAEATRDPAGHRYEVAFRLRHRDGGWRWFLSIAGFIGGGQSGEPRRMVGVHIDITSQRMAQQLESENESARMTLRSIGDGVIVTDAAGRVQQLNDTAMALTGWSEAEARGRDVADVLRLVTDDDEGSLLQPVMLALREGRIVDLPGNARLLARDGRERAVQDSAAPIRLPDGRVLGAVVVFRDVTESRRLLRDARWQATHDALTELPNRREFEGRLKRLVERPPQPDAKHALLSIDLDRFKAVNDACGHPAGDRLLVEVSRLFSSVLRERDMLARLGGDEFAVILERTEPEIAQQVADKLLREVREYRFVHDGRAFAIGASIGLVPFEPGRYGADQVMRQADSACYSAKAGGRNQIVVLRMEDVAADPSRDMGLADRVARAIREDRLVLCRQPIVPVGGTTDGERFETLVRMRDDDGSVLLPGHFLTAAERADLVAALDRRVVERTLRWLAADRQRTVNLALCTVNLSARTLADPAYAEHVSRLLDETGFPAARLGFEFSETAALVDLAVTRRFIDRMRELGCETALDEFGTGLASILHLKLLPVDYVKIGESFVTSIVDSPIDAEVVRSISDLSHSLGRRTIAEFVATPQIMERLAGLGVDYAQGYWIAPPVEFSGAVAP